VVAVAARAHFCVGFVFVFRCSTPVSCSAKARLAPKPLSSHSVQPQLFACPGLTCFLTLCVLRTLISNPCIILVLPLVCCVTLLRVLPRRRDVLTAEVLIDRLID
jgi:hypothetical protein